MSQLKSFFPKSAGCHAVALIELHNCFCGQNNGKETFIRENCVDESQIKFLEIYNTRFWSSQLDHGKRYVQKLDISSSPWHLPRVHSTCESKHVEQYFFYYKVLCRPPIWILQKYLMAGPSEMPLRSWYNCGTKHFHPTMMVDGLVEMKNPTRFSNTTSTAWSYGKIRFWRKKPPEQDFKYS